MGFLELFLIAVGLSMDAFAVSLCKGLSMKKINYVHAGIIGLFFGGFQAAMPVIGWLLGRQFERYISNLDHWVAFGLLAFLGAKMIIEALKKEEVKCGESKLDIKELLILSVATSIDALAVGITFAFLQMSIWLPISLIGVITLVLSFFGVLLGNKFGVKYKAKAEIAGGIILILIGVKILLEHLGVFG